MHSRIDRVTAGRIFVVTIQRAGMPGSIETHRCVKIQAIQAFFGGTIETAMVVGTSNHRPTRSPAPTLLHGARRLARRRPPCRIRLAIAKPQSFDRSRRVGLPTRSIGMRWPASNGGVMIATQFVKPPRRSLSRHHPLSVLRSLDRIGATLIRSMIGGMQTPTKRLRHDIRIQSMILVGHRTGSDYFSSSQPIW